MKRKVTNVEKPNNNYLKKIRNRVLAFILTGGIVVGGVSIPVVNKINEIKNHPENTYGYSNVIMGDFIHNQSNTFVLLDAGDYNTKGAFFFDKKIEYCKENGMSVGIIINESDVNYNVIYKDVELAKSILKNNEGKVDLPIFFNIDNIVENYDLTSSLKAELITSFLTKCESNGMFVGIYGKDVNLKRLKEICESIKEYNACVIVENEEGKVEYDGNYNYVKYPNGRIVAKEDFSKYIIEGSLNTTERFVNDTIYTVSNGEDILDISIKYNITPNDLLKFNGLSIKDIKEGTILRIPSVLGKYAPYKQTSSSLLEAPLVGIDISNHQMNNKYEYNPDTLADNFDFVIIKSTEGKGWVDQSFDKISKDCIDRGISIGAYAINTIIDVEESEEIIRQRAEAQTQHFLSTIQNKKIDYPVYLDFEGDSENMLLNSPDKFKIILEVWYEKVSNAGYTPGLYMNKSMYNSMINSSSLNTSDFDLNENFEMWVAGNKNYYLSEEKKDKYLNTFYEIDEVKPSNNELGVEMIQPTNVGDGRQYGAANSYGKIDINFSYKDYTNELIPIENVETELLEIIEPNQLPDAKRVGISLGGLGVVLAGGFMIHRKRKRRIR